MLITVIGLGFVGLTTALGFSEKGYQVYGYDIDEKKINNLQKGHIPFYEPSLEKVLQKHITKNFLVVNDLKEAIKCSDIIFLCVGTPSKEDGGTNLTYIDEAIKNVVETIKMLEHRYKVIVVKSTVPPGSTSDHIKPFIENLGFTVGKTIGLVNNPEFLREGYAWEDFMYPDRIVIGEDDKKSGEIIAKMYQVFNVPIYRVTLNTAEFIKYLSNTLLASLISFANEQSMIAHTIGSINVKQAFQILHLDKRWIGDPAPMTSYVFPGCGFGGYCLPKDTKALISKAEIAGYSPDLLKNTITVNEKIKDFVVNDLLLKVGLNERIGILGLAFKPHSNDVRDTPARAIINRLLHSGYKDIIAYDPMAVEQFKTAFHLPIRYASNLKMLLSEVEHVVILTAWDEFIENEAMIKEKQLFDYRYLF